VHGIARLLSLGKRRIGEKSIRAILSYERWSLRAKRQGAVDSNLRGFGKGQGVFDVDPKIAYSVLDFAMAEQDLNSTEVVRRLAIVSTWAVASGGSCVWLR
jgi:hypothetical protein